MKINRSLAFLLLFFLAGCGTFQVGVEQTPDATQVMQALLTAQARLTEIAAQPTATPVPPTPTEIPPTPFPPTALPPTSVPTALPQATDTQPAPHATASPMTVKIFLIAVGDEGVSGKKIGCGDSAVPVDVQIQSTQAVLKTALQSLLAVKQQFYGQSGLYNSLYQSDLKVESVKIGNGKATINLTGTLSLAGECDTPRVQAQLEETARQFSTVSDVAIFVNGKSLADALSLK